MSEDLSDVEYKHGDIVWVKLSQCWWPGEVVDFDQLPENVKGGFRKTPLVSVKFFQEDTFEFVKKKELIYPYNSDKKDEFLKRGLELYRGNYRYMDKFPADVLAAEKITGGSDRILDDPKYLPEPIRSNRNVVAEIFGSPNVTKRNKDGTKAGRGRTATRSHNLGRRSLPANIGSGAMGISSSGHRLAAHTNIDPLRYITHPRFLTVNTSADGTSPIVDHIMRIMVRTTSLPTEQTELAQITTGIDQEQPEEHKCNQCGFITNRLEMINLHYRSHLRTGTTPLSSAINFKQKQKKTSTPKKSKKIKMTRSITSSFDEDLALLEMGLPIVAESESMEMQDAEDGPRRSKENINSDTATDNDLDLVSTKKRVKRKKTKKSLSNISPDAPKDAVAVALNDEQSKIALERSIKEAIQKDLETCFDFDEEPEDDIEMPDISTTKVTNEEEILQTSQQDNKTKEKSKKEDDDTDIYTFREILESTEVSKLPDLPELRKFEKKIICEKTNEVPDKSPESGSDNSKLINPKKRFVKSFEQSLEQDNKNLQDSCGGTDSILDLEKLLEEAIVGSSSVQDARSTKDDADVEKILSGDENQVVEPLRPNEMLEKTNKTNKRSVSNAEPVAKALNQEETKKKVTKTNRKTAPKKSVEKADENNTGMPSSVQPEIEIRSKNIVTRKYSPKIDKTDGSKVSKTEVQEDDKESVSGKQEKIGQESVKPGKIFARKSRSETTEKEFLITEKMKAAFEFVDEIDINLKKMVLDQEKTHSKSRKSRSSLLIDESVDDEYLTKKTKSDKSVETLINDLEMELEKVVGEQEKMPSKSKRLKKDEKSDDLMKPYQTVDTLINDLEIEMEKVTEQEKVSSKLKKTKRDDEKKSNEMRNNDLESELERIVGEKPITKLKKSKSSHEFKNSKEAFHEDQTNLKVEKTPISKSKKSNRTSLDEAKEVIETSEALQINLHIDQVDEIKIASKLKNKNFLGDDKPRDDRKKSIEASAEVVEKEMEKKLDRITSKIKRGRSSSGEVKSDISHKTPEVGVEIKAKDDSQSKIKKSKPDKIETPKKIIDQKSDKHESASKVREKSADKSKRGRLFVLYEKSKSAHIIETSNDDKKRDSRKEKASKERTPSSSKVSKNKINVDEQMKSGESTKLPEQRTRRKILSLKGLEQLETIIAQQERQEMLRQKNKTKQLVKDKQGRSEKEKFCESRKDDSINKEKPIEVISSPSTKKLDLKAKVESSKQKKAEVLEKDIQDLFKPDESVKKIEKSPLKKPMAKIDIETRRNSLRNTPAKEEHDRLELAKKDDAKIKIGADAISNLPKADIMSEMYGNMKMIGLEEKKLIEDLSSEVSESPKIDSKALQTRRMSTRSKIDKSVAEHSQNDKSMDQESLQSSITDDSSSSSKLLESSVTEDDTLLAQETIEAIQKELTSSTEAIISAGHSDYKEKKLKDDEYSIEDMINEDIFKETNISSQTTDEPEHQEERDLITQQENEKVTVVSSEIVAISEDNFKEIIPKDVSINTNVGVSSGAINLPQELELIKSNDRKIETEEEKKNIHDVSNSHLPKEIEIEVVQEEIKEVDVNLDILDKSEMIPLPTISETIFIETDKVIVNKIEINLENESVKEIFRSDRCKEIEPKVFQEEIKEPDENKLDISCAIVPLPITTETICAETMTGENKIIFGDEPLETEKLNNVDVMKEKVINEDKKELGLFDNVTESEDRRQPKEQNIFSDAQQLFDFIVKRCSQETAAKNKNLQEIEQSKVSISGHKSAVASNEPADEAFISKDIVEVRDVIVGDETKLRNVNQSLDVDLERYTPPLQTIPKNEGSLSLKEQIEAPKRVETPKTINVFDLFNIPKPVEAPNITEASKTFDVPKSVAVSKTLEASDIFEMPENVDTPKLIEVSETFDIPKSVEALTGTDVSETFDFAESVQESTDEKISEIYDIPKSVVEANAIKDSLKSLNVPKVIEESHTIDIPETINASKLIELVEAEKVTKKSNIIEISETPKAFDSLEATETPKLIDGTKISDPRSSETVDPVDVFVMAENIIERTGITEVPKTSHIFEAIGSIEMPKAIETLKDFEVRKSDESEVREFGEMMKQGEVSELIETSKSFEAPGSIDAIEVPQPVEAPSSIELSQSVEPPEVLETPLYTPEQLMTRVEDIPLPPDLPDLPHPVEDIPIPTDPPPARYDRRPQKIGISMSLKHAGRHLNIQSTPSTATSSDDIVTLSPTSFPKVKDKFISKFERDKSPEYKRDPQKRKSFTKYDDSYEKLGRYETDPSLKRRYDRERYSPSDIYAKKYDRYQPRSFGSHSLGRSESRRKSTDNRDAGSSSSFKNDEKSKDFFPDECQQSPLKKSPQKVTLESEEIQLEQVADTVAISIRTAAGTSQLQAASMTDQNLPSKAATISEPLTSWSETVLQERAATKKSTTPLVDPFSEANTALIRMPTDDDDDDDDDDEENLDLNLEKNIKKVEKDLTEKEIQFEIANIPDKGSTTKATLTSFAIDYESGSEKEVENVRKVSKKRKKINDDKQENLKKISFKISKPLKISSDIVDLKLDQTKDTIKTADAKLVTSKEISVVAKKPRLEEIKSVSDIKLGNSNDESNKIEMQMALLTSTSSSEQISPLVASQESTSSTKLLEILSETKKSGTTPPPIVKPSVVPPSLPETVSDLKNVIIPVQPMLQIVVTTAQQTISKPVVTIAQQTISKPVVTIAQQTISKPGITIAQQTISKPVFTTAQQTISKPVTTTTSVVINKSQPQVRLSDRRPRKLSKPTIISEQIVKHENQLQDATITVQKISSQQNYDDIEDIDTFIIQKTPIPPISTTTNAPIITPAMRKLQSTSPISTVVHHQKNKPTIIEQTIITPSGQVINQNKQKLEPETTGVTETTTSTVSTPAVVVGVTTTSSNDDQFDINSMPIVLGDEFLTSDSIGNVVLAPSQPQTTTTAVTTTMPTVTKQVQPMKLLNKTPTFKQTKTVIKTIKSKAEIEQSQSQIVSPLLKTAQTLLTQAQLSQIQKSQKYIIMAPESHHLIPTSTITRTPIIKRQVFKKASSILNTSNAPAKTLMQEQVTGKLVLVTTNPAQQRLLIPAQQRTVLYQTVPKKLKDSKGPNIISQTIINPKGQITTTTNPILSSPNVTNIQQQMKKKQPEHLLKTKLPNTRLLLAPTIAPITQSKNLSLPQPKTYISKSPLQSQAFVQQQQQKLDEATLEQQVAEQLEAINRAASLQQHQQVNQQQQQQKVSKPQQSLVQQQHLTPIVPTKTVRRTVKKLVESPKIQVQKQVIPDATKIGTQLQQCPIVSNQAELMPPLAPISPTKKTPESATILKSRTSQQKVQKPGDVVQSATRILSPKLKVNQAPVHQQQIEVKEAAKPVEKKRPPHQLVIQDALGNQTTITEGQIFAIPSETSLDGQHQSYMLVTVDETGNLTPLNNEALMSLDPNLSGDLNNMVLQIDQGPQYGANVTAKIETKQPEMMEVETKPVLPEVQQIQVQLQPETIIQSSISEVKKEPQPNVIQEVAAISGEAKQQLIITGDPIAAQKFLDSLSEGNQELTNLLATAEGNIIIHAEGEQIFINTNPDPAQQLLIGAAINAASESQQQQSVFEQPPVKPTKSKDILAAALAGTDVFQTEPIVPPTPVKSQLSPGNHLFPMSINNVLETNATSSPIMCAAEVPTNKTKKIDESINLLTQVNPKNVDLPITITDPNISQTVANQQMLAATELQTGLDLPLITQDLVPSASEIVTSALTSSYAIQESKDISERNSTGPISMPLLTEEPEEVIPEPETKDIPLPCDIPSPRDIPLPEEVSSNMPLSPSDIPLPEGAPPASSVMMPSPSQIPLPGEADHLETKSDATNNALESVAIISTGSEIKNERNAEDIPVSLIMGQEIDIPSEIKHERNAEDIPVSLTMGHEIDIPNEIKNESNAEDIPVSLTMGQEIDIPVTTSTILDYSSVNLKEQYEFGATELLESKNETVNVIDQKTKSLDNILQENIRLQDILSGDERIEKRNDTFVPEDSVQIDLATSIDKEPSLCQIASNDESFISDKSDALILDSRSKSNDVSSVTVSSIITDTTNDTVDLSIRTLLDSSPSVLDDRSKHSTITSEIQQDDNLLVRKQDEILSDENIEEDKLKTDLIETRLYKEDDSINHDDKISARNLKDQEDNSLDDSRSQMDVRPETIRSTEDDYRLQHPEYDNAYTYMKTVIDLVESESRLDESKFIYNSGEEQHNVLSNFNSSHSSQSLDSYSSPNRVPSTASIDHFTSRSDDTIITRASSVDHLRSTKLEHDTRKDDFTLGTSHFVDGPTSETCLVDDGLKDGYNTNSEEINSNFNAAVCVETPTNEHIPEVTAVPPVIEYNGQPKAVSEETISMASETESTPTTVSINSSSSHQYHHHNVQFSIKDDFCSRSDALCSQMCNSLSEPPPDMFDFSMDEDENEGQSYGAPIPSPGANSSDSCEIPVQPDIVTDARSISSAGTPSMVMKRPSTGNGSDGFPSSLDDDFIGSGAKRCKFTD